MEPIAKKWVTQAENCLKILNDIRCALQNGSPADRTLAAIYRENRCYGSRDRQFFYKAVFAYFRWLGWLSSSVFRDAPEALQVLAALVTDGCEDGVLPPAALALAERSGDPGKWIAAASLTSPEQRFAAISGAEMADSALIPRNALNLLADGAETAFLPFLRTRSPLWVRVAPGYERAASEEWKQAGLTFDAHPRIGNAFRFPNDRIRFDSFECWKRGVVEMQDFSSQCIGLAACAQAGENWFDPCAGGGGKSLQLASMVGNKGSVTVSDIRTFKLDVLERRAARTPFAKHLKRSDICQNEQFDGVLVDAPCSSSGRWRRNPDGRWTGAEDKIAEITETQYDILENAAKRVRPGGKLVYGTCSVFAAENRRLAERFLAEHGNEFEPMPWTSPHTGGNLADGMLQTFPADADCDGSFAALFRRK